MSQPKSQFIVRRARPEDKETIVEFNYRLAKETEDKILDRALLDPGVATALVRPDLCLYFVAELEGEVIAQLMITYEWSDWHNQLYWWLQSVYVREDYRGKGLFKSLFEFVRGDAERSGEVCGFCLYVDKQNERAKRTYRNLGFSMSNYEVMECEVEGR